MNTPLRISISEASKLFGVSPITIRRAIKERELSYVVVRGRYQLNFESVLKWSQQSSRIAKKTEESGIGQYVEKWRIKNPLFSPNPKLISPKAGDAALTGRASRDNSGAVGEIPERGTEK